MAKRQVQEELFDLLGTKIYSINPSLIRNDTKAAQFVVSYVNTVVDLNRNWLKQKAGTRTRLQEETLQTMFITESLRGLSEDTLRKYIAELWEQNAFADFTFSTNVNDSR